MKIKKFHAPKGLVEKLIKNQEAHLRNLDESKKVGPSVVLTEKRIDALRRKIADARFDDVTDEGLAWLECDRERALTSMVRSPVGALVGALVMMAHGERAARILNAVTATYSEAGRMLFPVQPMPPAPVLYGTASDMIIVDEIPDGGDAMGHPNGEAEESRTGGSGDGQE